MAELARIRGQLERVRALCGDGRLFDVNARVSRWSPAEHFDHLLRVTISVVDRLSSPESLPGKISLVGRTILAIGWIPRGKGRAPERLAGKRTSHDVLQRALEKVTAAVGAIDAAAVDAARHRNVPHPRFGNLTPSEALRFTRVHNEHHLKIVRDILGVR
ncbi:MAG TPA: DinB family protein [Thermoanaerobaculia bacterium]|nr:DinB family protein [Thermoanaerobaculia bacterium]